MPALEEITVEYLGEKFRFENPDGDVVIAEGHANGTINSVITLKGPADDELLRRHTYRFYGRWTEYRNRRSGQTERQFAFETFVAAQPHNRQGVVVYLRAAGEGHYFGQARAVAMWEEFGPDAVRVMREETDKACEALARRGLPLKPEPAAKIADILAKKQLLEACTIELTELLAGRGMPKATARYAIARWGNGAANIIRRDPFKLMTASIPGCGFTRCDQLYLHLRRPAGRLKRQALAAWYALHSDGSGHVWFPRPVAVEAVRKSIAGAALRTDKAIELCLRAGLLREIRTDGPHGPITPNGSYVWLATSEHADNERELAERIAAASQESYQWPAVSTIKHIDGEQPEVLAKTLAGPIAMLGGSPGTGKTFTAANLISACEQIFGPDEILIGAPTNLAAQRLTEVMASHGVELRARTWHSILGKPDVRGEKWRHNQRNPLRCKLLVGDEESMKSAKMMLDVFRARAVGTQFLIIGDINQLPPIDAGAPLRDMIAAGLPSGELRQIRRNSGGIVEACAAIRDGKPWGAGDNLEIIEVDDPAVQEKVVIDQLELARRQGIDPVWDTRVIVARNETRRTLNTILQQHLNRRPGIPGSPFRIGDKVISTANTEYEVVEIDRDDEEIEVNENGDRVRCVNGDVGEVIEVLDKHFIIKALSPTRVVKVPRKPVAAKSVGQGGQGDADDAGDGSDPKATGTGCAWELAYAITFHKSQGSEFPWAILVVGKDDSRMGCRELIFTGISRGKQKAKLIGMKWVYDRMCQRVALPQRKTLLKERILLELAKAELATL